MDATKAEIINQIRELNALLIQAKLHVGRSKLAHHFHRDELDSDIRGCMARDAFWASWVSTRAPVRRHPGILATSWA